MDLHEAAFQGDLRRLRELLGHDFDANAKGRLERTPLHEAARGGHCDAVRLLVDCGADVNARDSVGRTPLHEAAAAGRCPVLRLLLDLGAEVNAKALGDTPRDFACRQHQKEAFQLLKERGGEGHFAVCWPPSEPLGLPKVGPLPASAMALLQQPWVELDPVVPVTCTKCMKRGRARQSQWEASPHRLCPECRRVLDEGSCVRDGHFLVIIESWSVTVGGGGTRSRCLRCAFEQEKRWGVGGRPY